MPAASSMLRLIKARAAGRHTHDGAERNRLAARLMLPRKQGHRISNLPEIVR